MAPSDTMKLPWLFICGGVGNLVEPVLLNSRNSSVVAGTQIGGGFSRQPGSSFKPFLYSAALDHGVMPATRVNDAPLEIGGWAPQNSDGRFDGPMTVREALARSKNLVSVRLLQQIGVPAALAWASRFGFEQRQQPAPGGQQLAEPEARLGVTVVRGDLEQFARPLLVARHAAAFEVQLAEPGLRARIAHLRPGFVFLRRRRVLAGVEQRIGPGPGLRRPVTVVPAALLVLPFHHRRRSRGRPLRTERDDQSQRHHAHVHGRDRARIESRIAASVGSAR